MAADYGLEYGLEVVNRYETNIANTGVQVCSLRCMLALAACVRGSCASARALCWRPREHGTCWA